MERTISSEEKIRRAEEIYARRRSGNTSRTIATVNVQNEKNYGLFKKMILQIAICLVIYFIYYLIQNGNYIFSEDVIKKTKEILSYDIDLQGMYTYIINSINKTEEEIIPPEEDIRSEQNTEINLEEENTQNREQIESAIGGAELENVIVETEKESIEQTDEEYIKANYSFIKPIEGIVSSEFGLRNVNNPIVSKNHTGIDIAANTGTEIKASMEGTVTISSTTGDYGYHIQITNEDVNTLYGHCSKLLVNVGDKVSQGQVIALVGSTGKSTGPHLHFEIKKGENYINPRNILEF